MIVGAAQLGKYQTTIGVYVYSYSAMGGLVSRYAESAVPFNQRNDYMSLHTAGGGNGIAPIGTPLVADYDGNDKADVILTSSNGAIHAFEFDPGTNTLTTKQGWPLLLPEIAREPVLAQLDPASEQYSLVVQCADGWLHVFDLPTAETTSDWWETWPSYGYDNGNSRGCPPVITGRGRTLHPGTVGRILGGPRIEAARPVPASDGVTIDLAMGSARVAQLEILDVSGRVVRHLHADAGKDCKGHVRWDGSTDDGRRLPCGVYWCICRTGEQDQPRRLVVLR